MEIMIRDGIYELKSEQIQKRVLAIASFLPGEKGIFAGPLNENFYPLISTIWTIQKSLRFWILTRNEYVRKVEQKGPEL